MATTTSARRHAACRRRARAGGGSDAPRIQRRSNVWYRELLRSARDRSRDRRHAGCSRCCSCSCSAPGCRRPSARSAAAATSSTQFIFPGVLAMSVLFTAIFSAVSIVWDREFGFLREMLVAPVPRWAIVVGKMLGGARPPWCRGC